MIDKAAAITIAEEFLNQDIETDADDSIVVTQVEESGAGWLIDYNSQKYLQTGDLLYSVVGAPLFVSQRDGSCEYRAVP